MTPHPGWSVCLIGIGRKLVRPSKRQSIQTRNLLLLISHARQISLADLGLRVMTWEEWAASGKNRLKQTKAMSDSEMDKVTAGGFHVLYDIPNGISGSPSSYAHVCFAPCG